jgi:hypothetical protein
MTPELRRSDLLAAGIVALIALATYVPLLPSGVWIGDEAEAQATAYVLGIMHPTGFPFFTLAGWLFSHVVALGTVAWRINLFVAVLSALTAAGVVVLARALGAILAAAAFAGLAYAFGNVVWGGAIHANVQVLSAACSVWSLAAAVTYARNRDVRALVAACALCGFGIAAHAASVWVLPAIAVALLWQWRVATRRVLAAAAAAFVLPLLLYAYLPLRSMAIADPAVTIAGGPSIDPGSLDWQERPPRTPAGFLDIVLGRNEHASSFLLRAFDPRGVPSAAAAWFSIANAQYRTGLLVLAAIGVAALAWYDRRALSVLFAGVAGGLLFAYAYRDDAHLDRYYVLSFAVTAALAAAASRIVLPRVPAAAASIAASLALALVTMAAVPGDRPNPLPRPPEDGEAIVAQIARDVPSNAIVVAEWNEATALRYGAFVEHALGGRTIVSATPDQYEARYPAWSRGRPVVIFLSPREWQWVYYLADHGDGELPTSRPPYRLFLVRPWGGRAPVRPSGLPLFRPRVRTN